MNSSTLLNKMFKLRLFHKDLVTRSLKRTKNKLKYKIFIPFYIPFDRSAICTHHFTCYLEICSHDFACYLMTFFKNTNFSFIFLVPHHTVYGGFRLPVFGRFTRFGVWRIQKKNTKLAWCPGVR